MTKGICFTIIVVVVICCMDLEMKAEKKIKFDSEETGILEAIARDHLESNLVDSEELDDMVKAAENTLQHLKNGGNNGI